MLRDNYNSKWDEIFTQNRNRNTQKWIMMEPDQTNQSFTFQDDKIDLKELFGLLWEAEN